MFLKPDKVITLTVGGRALTVKQRIIPDSLRAEKDVADYVKKGQPMKPCAPVGTAGKPLGICVHNTDDMCRLKNSAKSRRLHHGPAAFFRCETLVNQALSKRHFDGKAYNPNGGVTIQTERVLSKLKGRRSIVSNGVL